MDVRIDEIVLRALEAKPELPLPNRRRDADGSGAVTRGAWLGSSPSLRDPASPASSGWWARVRSRNQLAREIRAHMTEGEKAEFLKSSLLFAVWNAVTWFGPFFFVTSLPRPLGWIYGAAALVIGLSFLPFLHKMLTGVLGLHRMGAAAGHQAGSAQGFRPRSPFLASAGRWLRLYTAGMIALAVTAVGGFVAVVVIVVARPSAIPAAPAPTETSAASNETSGRSDAPLRPGDRADDFQRRRIKGQVFLDLDSGDFADAPPDVL